ncbi:NnrS family protein [Massilia sp. S19_KUP03_FR1]|uniref:NnrS family protein n=1 Tax=Massilia sp. S19_KUP03_FR1 TaxID=3025503 RepID=UPI002FCDB285
MKIAHIDEPRGARATPTRRSTRPPWRLGFRPFYLAAAVLAALAIRLWMAQYLGGIDGAAMPVLHVGLGWHMHEMVFGMATAVVHLAALALLWCAGRGVMLFAPPLLAAVVDWVFLPLATWPLWRVLKQSSNRRNYFLVFLLGLLAVANGVYHAGTVGWLALSPMAPVQAAILVIVVMASAIDTPAHHA